MQEVAEQVSIFDLDTWSGRTSAEPFQAERRKEKTSASSSKKCAGSQTLTLQFLDLRTGSGLVQGASWQTDSALGGEFTMLNIGESPNVAVESRLSQIMEEHPHPKYCLSAKACLGILNRAKRRGKPLPEALENALIQQSQESSLYKGCGERSMVEREVVITYGLDRASFNQGKNAQFGFSLEEEKIGAQTAKGPGAVFRDIVRRLTPLECERLQGFPDGWTDIGEWTDSNGKKHKTTDSLRYKALGNSIALPFWKWLLKRISAQYERDATMASLFDGIGGFPILWEQINGKGSCLWASEIEEFCIAVTKFHFGG